MMKRQSKIIYKVNWKDFVTPKHLRETPIHNWLVFPQSFSFKLVEELIKDWNLDPNDRICDPFCGAGTTLLGAKMLNIQADGYDISPYSIFASNVKCAQYEFTKLISTWRIIEKGISTERRRFISKSYPELVLKALSPEILSTVENIDKSLTDSIQDSCIRDFFRLALFAILPKFSRAKATGGWLKWVETIGSEGELHECYGQQVKKMLSDLNSTTLPAIENKAHKGDARALSIADGKYSAIITSPPYPNRHDYTRVFGIELMYGFLNWEETREVRYQSLHSHPEAKPIRPSYVDYIQPRQLTLILQKLEKKCTPRVLYMLEGYFIDLYCSIREMNRICAKGAKMAIVLGNAQYSGVPIPVDRLAVEIAQQLGLECRKIIVARMRGNSAQQMKSFGRNPSRESVVILEKK